MALAGSLKDFNLADIFQLIAQESKSGILHIKSGRFIIRVFFFNGNVVRAELFENGRASDVLLTMLLRAGVIDTKDYQYVVDKRAKSMRRTEDILLDEGFVSKEDLVLFLKLKNSELLYKLMGWKEGNFEFEPTEVSVNSAYDIPQQTDGVLMDTFRIVDEWPSINNVISAVNMKFTFNPQAEDFDQVAKKNEFGESERRVYSLLLDNPEYDVQKLIDISRLGEFETCKALYNLVRTGIITPLKPKHPVPFNALKGGPLSSKRIVIPSVFILNMILGVVAVISILLFMSGIVARVKAFRSEDASGVLRIAIYKQLIADISKERILNSAYVYRYTTGGLPERMDELVKAGLLEERDLSYPFRMRYRYKVDAKGVYIESPIY